MKNWIVLAVLAIMFGLCLAVDANAQCANGNCSSRNASLGEANTLPVPVLPAPAPQIAYYTAPTGGAASASSSASSGGGYSAPTGNLVVAGYTAPPQPAPQMAFYTVPVNPVGTSASTSASSTATAPALIGASTNLACQNGGCGGRGFRPFQGIRARRGGSFSKSVSISRS